MQDKPRVTDANTSSTTDPRAARKRPGQRNDIADDRGRGDAGEYTDSSATKEESGENEPDQQQRKNDL
jgi:hypothetical protein